MEMTSRSRLARWAAGVGGGLGCVTVLTVWNGQMHIAEILRGQLPLRVGIGLSGSSLAFLAMLLLLCMSGIAIALWRAFPQVWAGVLWLGIGGLLLYAVYVSRFSMGPLLIPSAALFLAAGILASWQWQRRSGHKSR